VLLKDRNPEGQVRVFRKGKRRYRGHTGHRERTGLGVLYEYAMVVPEREREREREVKGIFRRAVMDFLRSAKILWFGFSALRIHREDTE
jgi:hypothetical protein